MAKDLYFIGEIADALQQVDPKPAFERAFKKIIELGQQPEYAYGFRQFKQFIGVMTKSLDASLSKSEHTSGQIWEESIFQLYPGLVDDDQNEISNLLEFIGSHPSLEEFDNIYQEIIESDVGSFHLKINILKNGENFCSIVVENCPFITKIKDVLPGLYEVKLNTGRILWQGEFTDQDLFWTAAFPDSDMSMAANTGDTTDYTTREIILLAEELTIRVVPGLESGCIEMEIRN